MSNVEELKDKIHDLQEDILQIHINEWESLYKERCPKYYMSFLEFIDNISLLGYDRDEQSIWDKRNFEKECKYELDEATIKNVIDIAEKYNFKVSISYITQMVCEACACQGCPAMEKTACRECRKNYYDQYSGYCDSDC